MIQCGYEATQRAVPMAASMEAKLNGNWLLYGSKVGPGNTYKHLVNDYRMQRAGQSGNSQLLYPIQREQNGL